LQSLAKPPRRLILVAAYSSSPFLKKFLPLAISDRCSEVKLAALAFPPFNPPLRPMVARYSDMADLSIGFSFAGSGFSDSSSSSVERRTISHANWFASFGSFLLDRLMHPVFQKIAFLSSPVKMKLSHHHLSAQSRHVKDIISTFVSDLPSGSTFLSNPLSLQFACLIGPNTMIIAIVIVCGFDNSCRIFHFLSTSFKTGQHFLFHGWPEFPVFRHIIFDVGTI
jgi:hypothetical protein